MSNTKATEELAHALAQMRQERDYWRDQRQPTHDEQIRNKATHMSAGLRITHLERRLKASESRLSEREVKLERVKKERDELKERDAYWAASQTTPESWARMWLRENRHLRWQGTEAYVQLTEDNAGLIMAAFPEQVGMVAVYPQDEAALIQYQGTHRRLSERVSVGQWCRVDSYRLTPVDGVGQG